MYRNELMILIYYVADIYANIVPPPERRSIRC